MKNEDVAHKKNIIERINTTSKKGKHSAQGKWKKTRKRKMMTRKLKKRTKTLITTAIKREELRKVQNLVIF
jgi:hypothetical protein